MPQTPLDLGRGGFSPVEIAKAYRDEHPRMFDDLDDGELMKAIEQEDPDTFALVDPLLIGSELLPHGPAGAAPPPPKLPTPPVPRSTADTLIESGLRIVPAIGGALMGTVVEPGVGSYVGGATGAGIGETAAQYYEKHYGNREEYSPGSIAFEAALGSLNPAARGESILARTAYQTGFGGVLGGGGTVGRSLIEEGQLPSASQVGIGALTGAAFGGATHLGFEAAHAGVARIPGFADVTGALPPPSPLAPPAAADQLPLAIAAHQQYEAEEARLAASLHALYGPDAAAGRQSDFHTAMQAKSYLEELAALNQPPVAVPPLQPDLTETPYAEPPAVPQLPPGRGDPGAFRAYPPGVNPDLELVGSSAPSADRVIGGRDVGIGSGPPPTLRDIATQTTAGTAEPGPPRLVPRAPEALELTPSPGGPVPRGIAEQGTLLQPRVRKDFQGKIEQGGTMGGQAATPEQPRLPGTAEPRPLDRTYATGPNAGPRRKGEAHGEPRLVKRQLRVGGKIKYEWIPSDLKAEDPGTYPPEVRREMARMAEELDALPHIPRHWEYAPEDWTYEAAQAAGFTAAGGKAKIHPAVGGAPVYHDILQAAGGAKAHATRSAVLKDLRAALLEGRGGYISDAAAQVARTRLEQEAAQATSRSRKMAQTSHALPPGSGDALIGWTDEAGQVALPDQDLDEFTRAARDMEDGELLGTMRLEDAGGVSEGTEGYFRAARAEAVRRGLVPHEQQQPPLQMGGPGGDKGPSVFDFEGGEEQPPAAAAEVSEEPPPPPSGRAAKDLAAGRDVQALAGAPPEVSEARHAELMRKFAGGTPEERAAAFPPQRPEVGGSPPEKPLLVPRSPNLKEPFGPEAQPSLPEAPPALNRTRPEKSDYVPRVLAQVGHGTPGLSEGVRPSPIPALGDVRDVTYRGADGTPIATASLIPDASGKLLVMDFAADKTKGLLTGRAVAAVGKRLQELGATTPAGSVTPDALRLIEHAREAEQPTLPGAEDVRTQEIPTPEVADLPFALSPPPAKPERAGRFGERTPAPLLQRLLDEEGVLVFKVPSGDRVGLRKWLKQQEDEHGGEAWFSRVEHHLEDGEWDKAWKAAASASVRSYAKAVAAAKSPQDAALLAQSVRGTPLQSDINTEIIAAARGRSGLGTAPRVGEFPPSQQVSQAGAARGKATIGPAGIVNPGPPQKPLKSTQRAHTLPRTFVETVIQETDPDLIHIIPGNEDSMLRIYRQMGDLALAGTNTKDLKQYLHLSDQEIGQHFIESVQEAARTLQSLSAFRAANEETLTAAANQMSMGGALRGMLGEGRVIVGKRGQVIGTTGPTMDAQATLDRLTESTGSFDQAMLANTLQRPKKASELELLQAASYPFMLMRWRTAVRNAMSTAGRYTVDALDDALTIPLATLMGDREGAALAKGTAAEKFKLRGKTTGLVTPRTAWKSTLQDIYDFTSASLGQLSPGDARRTLALLEKVPDTQAHFLGAMAGGEQFSEGGSRFTVLNAILDPKLQRILTVFNRAQEFSGRGVVFDATMRGQLRAKGLNPDQVLQLPYADLVSQVGGAPEMDHLLHNATAAALESTFSGVAAKQSIPGALLQAVNKIWPLKLGYPFPKFNIVAAPRWIYDHSPAALMELLRFPLDTVGLTSGEFAGGRLYRGVRGQRFRSEAIPELAGKRQDAIGRLGTSLREYAATGREFSIRSRQVARLEARAQSGLPDVATALDTARIQRDQLARRRDTLKSSVALERDRIRKLKGQEDKLLDVVRDAQGINAPTLPQYLARMTTGTALLGAAAVIRAQKDAEGTRWYEYKYDKGDGSDPDILDFRPYAPFAQYLYVADVMQDLARFTDWTKASAQADTDGWTRGMWDNYQGKYTREELGAQFAQAFLSISRAGGTTLTLTDLMTQNGWPSPQDATDAIVGTVGQFLSRFYTGFGDVKDVAAGFSEEEAKVRIPPRATTEEWTRPLAAPLSQVPGVSRLIPERISQTTGQPVTTTHPWLRALAGIGSAPRDFITEEVRRVGVPGQSVFIRETGDYGLDKLVAETYAGLLQQELPSILEDPEYTALGSPAAQRDFLQRYIFPPLKRAAMGEVRGLLGEERYQGATVQGEAARRRQRQLALVDQLDAELPPVEASQQDQPEAGLAGTAPPGPPAPAAGTSPAPPPTPPPGF